MIFRDWLRRDAEDRALYAAAKQDAAAADEDVEHYNAPKQQVLRNIYGRAVAAAGFVT